MAKKELRFNQLIAGEVRDIIKVPVVAGSYKMGDLLECTVTENALSEKFTKSKTPALTSDFAVCYEDVTVEEGDLVVCIKQGYFNKHALKINDTEATDSAIGVLRTKNIYVTDATKY